LLKAAAFRVGDGDDDRANAGGLAVADGAGDLLQRGAGRHHVVDDHDVFAADRFIVDQAEGVADVFLALFLRVEVRLRFGITQPRDGMGDAELAALREPIR